MMRSVSTAVAILISAPSLSAQRAPFVLLVNIAEYFSDTYIDGPIHGADYVYFVGEPIRLDIQVLNTDGAEHTVVPQFSTAPGALSAKAVRDGQPTDVGVTISAEVERHEDVFRIPVEWGNVRLNPRASLHWKAELARSLPSGTYMVDFAITVSDESERPPVPRASRFRFEVRDVSPGSAPEVLRRRAVRAWVEERYEVAETEAAALLRLHPNSIEAYSLLGRIAEAQGRRSAAGAAFQRAIDIAMSDSDHLFRYPNPWHKGELIDSLQSSLVRVARQ